MVNVCTIVLHVLKISILKHIVCTLLLTGSACFAQFQTVNDTITLSRQQAETVFLEKNLSLIVSKLDIDVAEAQVVQARLWPNPTLTVSEVNLWSNAKAEQLPPLWGDFGKTSEIVVEIEQLIQTAGKRKKMIAMEQVAADMAKEYFADFLRNLKAEFRNKLTELQYIQFQENVYRRQLLSMQNLIKAYDRQVADGNTGRAEYIRLKASELQFLKEINELQKENNQLQKELKVLMSFPGSTYIKITEEGFLPDAPVEALDLASLVNSAIENRPDVKASRLENLYNDRRYKYEKSLRTPDVTLIAGYDRGGNIMTDFVGFGFSIDIPFFNRNQGNIKSAKIAVEQTRMLAEEKIISAESEVFEAYNNLLMSKKLYDGIDGRYEDDLDLLLANYYKNFSERNISMIEYLDFVEAYIENKMIILSSKRNINVQLEELRYITGQE